ncbi:MAG: hypothetical protein H7296_16260 [Bacteroidia bacterium]|nr:hypothetical protein [Bacteroidia bacterium]
MKKNICCFVLLFTFFSNVKAQTESIEFKSRGAMPLRRFEYQEPSNFEVVNGKFNAALGSSNGYLFEINGIAVKQLKCNAKLTGKYFKVVLIDNSMNRTYVSLNEHLGSLTIHCLPDGKYELYYVGEAYRQKQKVNITATLIGSINHSKNLKTTH